MAGEDPKRVEALKEIMETIRAIESGRDTEPAPHYLANLRSLLAHVAKWESAVAERAKQITAMEAIKELRASGWMNHSPLRAPEKAWLERIFRGKKFISGNLLDFEVLFGTTEEMGGHGYSCRCRDNYKRKRKVR